MVGLPGETDDDVAAIAAMASSALEQRPRRRRRRARASRSPSRRSCPRRTRPSSAPASPARRVIRRRQELLRERLPRQVKVRFHDVETSLVEATMAMGGREVGELIEAAWRGGARFDGWSESFDVGIWRRAAAEVGVELGGPAWGGADELPWLAVDPLVGDAFLRGRGRARDARRDHRRLPRRQLRVVRRVRRRGRAGPGAMSWWLRELRARRPGALHLPSRHDARGAAHVRSRRHRAGAVSRACGPSRDCRCRCRCRPVRRGSTSWRSSKWPNRRSPGRRAPGCAALRAAAADGLSIEASGRGRGAAAAAGGRGRLRVPPGRRHAPPSTRRSLGSTASLA